MGRLEIIHDDKVLFDHLVESYSLTEHRDNMELTASFDPANNPYASGPAVGNLPGVPPIDPGLGEPPPGWGPDDPDPEPRDV